MFQGYCFMQDGSYTPGVSLESPEAAFRYILLQKDIQYEVRIVDADDFIVLQSINGKIVFPKEEQIND